MSDLKDKVKEKLAKLWSSAKKEMEEAVTRTEEEKGIDARAKKLIKGCRKLRKLNKSLLNDGNITDDEKEVLRAYKEHLHKLLDAV